LPQANEEHAQDIFGEGTASARPEIQCRLRALGLFLVATIGGESIRKIRRNPYSPFQMGPIIGV
jgi:hypothetical protein